jgi:DNA-binding CsgD family transcriptional regulator
MRYVTDVNKKVATLTPRQRECLRLVAELQDTQQIAHLLGLSPYTVDSYIREAVRLLGAVNRRQAAAMVREYEEANPPQNPPPGKIGYDFPAVEEDAEPGPILTPQSYGEAESGLAATVRDMPMAYEAISGTQTLTWSPLPGLERRPSSITPLRRLALIGAIVLGLGAGIGISVLTVAGAVVAVQGSRP